MANPFKFLQEVRAEASKVTWPTRRETMDPRYPAPEPGLEGLQID